MSKSKEYHDEICGKNITVDTALISAILIEQNNKTLEDVEEIIKRLEVGGFGKFDNWIYRDELLEELKTLKL